MTDFDCTNETCDSPVVCLQRGACNPDETDSRTYVQQLIEDMHERLRRSK